MKSWKNDITQLLNIKYPIVQAPMFGVTTPGMVASAGKAGALGSLSLGDLPADACTDAIRKTQTLTADPFAVNIFVHNIPTLSSGQKKVYEEAKHFIEDLAMQNRIDVTLPDLNEIELTDYHDQIDVLIKEQCKIVSFTFGNLDDQSIHKLKESGTILIGTCTSVREAKMLEGSGIDLLCVQGIEAGGHRGSFDDGHFLQIGGLSLLPQVYAQVKTPIIYAGGIYNARTLIAAQMLGAQGFQIGSLLLGTSESALSGFEKERLKSVEEDDIVLTKSFSGRYARGVSNKFIQTVESSGYILPYPYQNKLTNELRKIARATQNIDFVNIWTGQSLNAYSDRSTTDIIQDLISEVERDRMKILFSIC